MKITKIFGIIAGLLILGFSQVQSISAFSEKITITQLDSFTKLNYFKISYSALTPTPADIRVQFYVSKDGGAYNAFGSVLEGASGQIQVESGQVSETGKKYCFKAEIVGTSAFDETCTTFIQRTPAAPSNYWKERISGGLYRVHWKIPNEDDFGKVIVYRSKSIIFTAEDSTQVAEVGGTKDTETFWDDYGVDTGTEYYYLLRAIDKAGNASDLVGDTSVTTQVSGSAEPVQVLPGEANQSGTSSSEPEAQVLGAEEDATSSDKLGVVEEVGQFIKNKTKLSVGIALGVLVLVLLARYFINKKKNS